MRERKWNKLAAMLVILCLVFIQTSGLASATTSEIDGVRIVDNGPVIGEFVYDEDYAREIAAKEAMADRYYAAKTAGDEALLSLVAEEIGFVERDPVVLRATSNRISGIVQIPQVNDYYCGYAAIQSLLRNHGIYKCQYQIASEVYYTSEACPWYLSHGNSRDQFPVPIYLTNQIGFYYVPYPYGAAGTNQLEAWHVRPKVVSTIDNGYGLVCCGASWPGGQSYLPDYPNYVVVHWVAVDGYHSSGNYIWIVDPVANAGVPGFSNVTRYYSISANKFANFAEDRGLVW